MVNSTWMFTADRMDIHYEERGGRALVPDETIAKVEQIMLANRRIILDNLCVLVPEVSRSTKSLT